MIFPIKMPPRMPTFAEWMKDSDAEIQMQMHAAGLLKALRSEKDEDKRKLLKQLYDELTALDAKQFPEWLVKNGGQP